MSPTRSLKDLLTDPLSSSLRSASVASAKAPPWLRGVFFYKKKKRFPCASGSGESDSTYFTTNILRPPSLFIPALGIREGIKTGSGLNVLDESITLQRVTGFGGQVIAGRNRLVTPEELGWGYRGEG